MAWYKGNLHMHSYWSDGHNFPEMVADWFKNAGYDFIAFTEHDRHQIGEKWVSCDVARGSGRSMKDGDLLQKYKDRFGASWVDVKEEGKGSVRVKPLSEYRHLVEAPGQFLVITGEEVTTTWGGTKMSVVCIGSTCLIPLRRLNLSTMARAVNGLCKQPFGQLGRWGCLLGQKYWRF